MEMDSELKEKLEQIELDVLKGLIENDRAALKRAIINLEKILRQAEGLSK